MSNNYEIGSGGPIFPGRRPCVRCGRSVEDHDVERVTGEPGKCPGIAASYLESPEPVQPIVPSLTAPPTWYEDKIRNAEPPLKWRFHSACHFQHAPTQSASTRTEEPAVTSHDHVPPTGGESPDTSPQQDLQPDYPGSPYVFNAREGRYELRKEVTAGPTGPASPGGFGNSDLNLWVIGVLEAQLVRDRDSLEVLERHLQPPLLAEVRKTVHTNIERANTAISILRKQL